MTKDRAGPFPKLRSDNPRFWIRFQPVIFETVNRFSRLLLGTEMIEIREPFRQP